MDFGGIGFDHTNQHKEGAVHLLRTYHVDDVISEVAGWTLRNKMVDVWHAPARLPGCGNGIKHHCAYCDCFTEMVSVNTSSASAREALLAAKEKLAVASGRLRSLGLPELAALIQALEAPPTGLVRCQLPQRVRCLARLCRTSAPLPALFCAPNGRGAARNGLAKAVATEQPRALILQHMRGCSGLQLRPTPALAGAGAWICRGGGAGSGGELR